jgi:hypothetical protein
MRFNPYATGPVPELQPGELPPQVDVRQMSLFGAGWTAGSFKYLAEAGAQSITFYETTGWRGVMELASIGEFRGGKIIPMHSSHPLQTIGFLLRRTRSERIVIANLSQHRKEVKIEYPAREASVRYLDEQNVLTAMRSPEAFRSLPGVNLAGREGFLDLELLPFALAVVDAKLDHPSPRQR